MKIFKKAMDPISSETHFIGAILSLVALIIMMIVAAVENSPSLTKVGITVFGLSSVALYSASSIYHYFNGNENNKIKQFLRKMDHAMIYVLIAGTYTPVLLCSIRPIDPFWAWVILAIEWGCTIIGLILNAIDIKKYSTLSMVLYLAMGWGIVFRFNLLPEAVGMSGIYLLVAGGLAYTIGTIFYGLQNKHRYMHSIWHLWILLGSVLHFLCIILYVI